MDEEQATQRERDAYRAGFHAGRVGTKELEAKLQRATAIIARLFEGKRDDIEAFDQARKWLDTYTT
jgi:hypothetical protein